jgi:two-component system chemotaxis response regulator CheY
MDNIEQLENAIKDGTGAQGLRVLVVDDSGTMRRIVAKCLNQMGAAKIAEAADGIEALGRMRGEGPFDLVLTDWNMPVMNGMEFLKQVKADTALKDVPVVMVTTEAERTNVLEAIKAGAKNYVVKPFTLETLKAKIDQVLKS